MEEYPPLEMGNYGWLDGYLKDKRGVQRDYKAEWTWYRYRVREKQYAAVCHNKEKDPILTLKCDPMESEELRKQHPAEIAPGYYCDKRNWISIRLDLHLPEEIMKRLIDESYKLVVQGLPKKIRSELEEPV